MGEAVKSSEEMESIVVRFKSDPVIKMYHDEIKKLNSGAMPYLITTKDGVQLRYSESFNGVLKFIKASLNKYVSENYPDIIFGNLT